MNSFSGSAPNPCKSFIDAMPAAPAPKQTTRTSSIFLCCSSNAFNNAAAMMIAVPCWSSWNTGMSSCSISASSISKQAGAAISSRLIPPKVGAIFFTVRMKSSVESAFTSISKTSISAKALNSTPLPSITGLPASAPISPRPSTAVPSVITATRLPLAV